MFSHLPCEILIHVDYFRLRVEFLSQVFAVNVGAFSALDNHQHVLLRLDREQADSLSAEEVARRWGVLCPPWDGIRQPLAITAGWIKRMAQDRDWVETARERLCDLSWFMKFQKEPIAHQANAEDQVTGAFWEGQFKSVAILYETSLLATMAFIDLNPVAAHLAATPEASPHTSIKARSVLCTT